MLPVSRSLPSQDAVDLLALVHDIADGELRPRASAAEAAGEYPRDLIRTIGGVGLLGLPFDERYGGGGQPYEVYLQVLEELAAAWFTVALTVSVHSLACYPLAAFGSEDQRERWLPGMIGGDQLGAYCLSEAQAGSDAAALATRAVRTGERYRVDGVKAWITHAGVADFYTTMVRTGESGARGISCLLVDARADGVRPQPREHKMGLQASPTAQVLFDGAEVDADRRLGAEGEGFQIALSGLDGGRLGIAACAVGLAQAALAYAVDYARERRQFGRAVAEFQGVSFLLADMATQVEAGRSLYLQAARRRDRGQDYTREAAMAKLFCTDAAMRVTTDAVQVLGGAGYVTDHPVERWMREAKVLQIFEGTNQIQRLVIGRSLTQSAARPVLG